VDETDRHRETIIQDNWFDAPQLLAEPVSAVFGDGIFSLIPEVLWEALLTECGFAFTEQTLRGKNWDVYYKVYACSLHT